MIIDTDHLVTVRPGAIFDEPAVQAMRHTVEELGDLAAVVPDELQALLLRVQLIGRSRG